MIPILSAGIAPGLALLVFFYLRDRYETEPVATVAKAFFGGAAVTFPVMFFQYVLAEEHIADSGLAYAFLATAAPEEFMKWFVLYFLIYAHVHFDEPYDGIVYATSVSLGFASAENVLYLAANGVEYAFMRALLPVSGHALFGVVMGYYFSRAKFGTRHHEKQMLFLACILAIGLHGLYDYILLLEKGWIYWMIPFMLFLWLFAMWKVKKAHLLSDAHHQNQSGVQDT